MDIPAATIELPPWLKKYISDIDTHFSSKEDMMRFVIKLSRMNIEHQTGGPFAAGIFNMDTGELLTPGVNIVLSANCSIMHAEMLTIMMAQGMMETYDLSRSGLPSFEMIVSCEPCAMCFGAIPWSGIKQLTCGARDSDARKIGFDEGAKLADWKKALEDRDITVYTDICRKEAVEVLNHYQKIGGEIYNGRT